MDFYHIILFIVGLSLLLIRWLPNMLPNWPLSLPVLAVSSGFFPSLIITEADLIVVLRNGHLIERATELLVILSLMGAGLKIQRPFHLRTWRPVWLLLTITMVLTITISAALSWWYLGLVPAAAILLGAVISPTDPVLASDVESGPPGHGKEGFVRFSLTAEAGTNDGLAFPFTNLAIIIAMYGIWPQTQLLDWLIIDVVYKIAMALILGYICGRLIASWIFKTKKPHRVAEIMDGLVPLGATFFVYAVAELLQSYGFIAVFVAALNMRREFRKEDELDSSHKELYDFPELTERFFTIVFLIAFGAFVATELRYSDFQLDALLMALAIIFIVRPLAGILASIFFRARLLDKAVVSFFGVRGIGSFYYLAYALNRADFPDSNRIWQVLTMVVLISILTHSATASFVMRRVDQLHSK